MTGDNYEKRVLAVCSSTEKTKTKYIGLSKI